MNTRFADKMFRVIFIFVFVMGTVWMPNTRAAAGPPLALGDGLYAEYRDLGGAVVMFTVPSEGPINHGWNGACPDTNMYQNQCGLWAGTLNSWSLFEETLTGYIEAPMTGHYIFQSWIDDYLEITINGVTDISDSYGGDIYHIETDLTEGQFYPIAMHFKNRWGSNDLSLWWTLPGGTNEIVPKQYLYTEIPNQPELTLEKSAAPLTYLQAGDVINYTYQLTNTGDEILSGPFTVTDDKTTVACPSGNLDGTVLFDHFEGASLAQYVSGMPSYVGGLAGYGQAVDLSSGAWMRYNVPGWYQWPSTYDPIGKAGSVDLWVYPKQYGVGLVNFNWSSTNTPPPAGHILHLTITPQGKLSGGSWSAISGPVLTQLPTGSTTIPLNQWTHVAYVWGEDGTSLYVNGVVDAYSPDNLYPALNSTFYAYVPYWGYPGIGYVDDLRITSNSQTNFGVSALGPGESITCNAGYTITQADVDNGSLTNTAQAHAFFGADPVHSNQDTVTISINEYLQVKANFDIDEIQVWGLANGTPVTLSIDNPSNGLGEDYSTNGVIEPLPWDPNQFIALFQLQDEFDILPGHVITVAGDGQSKTMTVADIWGISIDVDADTVSGYIAAGSGARVHAGVNIDSGDIPVDENGYWIADLSLVGTDIKPGSRGYVQVDTEDGGTTWISFEVPNPRFSVHPDDDWMEGYDWTPGATVNISIDDPATPQNPDKTGSAVVGASDWNPDDYYFSLDLRNIYDIKPGFVVTVTDGQIIKEHVVTNLVVTGIDEPNNVISGTADPNVHLQVNVHNQSGANMQVDSNAGGIWSADFTGLYDLQLGDNGRVEEFDSDGDSTGDDWHVPNPAVGARANREQIEGWEWPLGATVTVTVDDPSTPASPDITRTAEVYDAPWNPGEHRFDLNLFGQFDIQPGFVVTASSGGITKSLLMTSLAFTDIDIDLDLVTGIAEAGSRVDVWSCGINFCINRHVTADGGGVWSADFAHPGLENDEQGTMDIVLGTWIDSAQREDDGDQTMFGQSVPNPFIEASANSNWVHAREWPIGTLVTLTISGSGETYTATMGQAPWNPTDPNDIVADFDLRGYRLQVGDVLTASANGITKVLTLSQLTATEFDVVADTVSGVATPGVQLQVCANIENRCITRWVTADAFGNWTANYHDPGTGNDDPDTFDVQAGSNGWAAEYEADADRTWYDWQVPNPNFAVHPDENVIEGNEWPLDSIVTIKIGDPAQPDYTTTTTLNPPDPDHNLPWFKLDLNGIYDLLPGELVTLSDTITTKQVIAASRAITQIDPLTDSIIGASDPDVAYVILWACDENGCGARRKDVNPDGSWSVNFAVPGELNWESILIDIQHGTNGGIYQSDVDGDGTVYQWMLNEPPHADLGADLVTDEGSTLMLDASASSDPDGDPLTYEWDFNNDGVYDDATGVTVNRTFPDDGAYFISVRVTDSFGASDTDTLQVTVNNISPFVDIQQVTVSGGLVSGDGFFTDPGADVWAAAVDYGDGSGMQPLALNPDMTFAFSHAYAVGGTFTIQVCVSDDEGASGCDQAQVTVTLNRPPVAEADGPYFGFEGSNITLNASRSTDPDNNIVFYEWDFDNDGLFDDAVGKRPKFKAVDNGIYIVRVRVTDAGGLSSVDGSTVTVKNVPPVITSLTFNSSVRVGVRLNTFAAFADPGLNDTFTAIWKWGDGTTSNGIVSGYTVSGSHVYARAGIYLVTITVKDKDGGTASASRLIIVFPKR
ncbi:MAG: PKD domain-containing protein [Chloroflexi bacterium]|nr:PKD domain-containing protein [Chloroflexota bacterium]